MKKLVFVFAFMALTAVQANAQQVTLTAAAVAVNAFGSPTEAGEYVVTPIDGAINLTSGTFSGCDGGGANCTTGWEYTYFAGAEFLDGSNAPGIASSTGLFQTPELALASATPFNYSVAADLCCLDFAVNGLFNANTFGSLTIGFALQQILGVITPGFSFSADDLVNLAFDPTTTFEIGPDELINDDLNFILAAIEEREGTADKKFDFSNLLEKILVLTPNESQFVDSDIRKAILGEIHVEDYAAAIAAGVSPTEYVVERAKIDASQETTRALAALFSVRLDDREVVPDPNPPANPLEQLNDPFGLQDALGAQNQSDMNDGIESVLPELTGFIVIAHSGPIKTYAAAGETADIVTASLGTGR